MSTQPESATPTLESPRTPERLLNSSDVAEWLGVSLDYVQAHATRRNPRIPAVKNHQWLVQLYKDWGKPQKAAEMAKELEQ